MSIDLSGIVVHKLPNWKTGAGSYFDETNGNFSVSINTADNSGSFGQVNGGADANFGLYMHFSGVDPNTNEAFETEQQMGARGGHGYVSFSVSGTLSIPAGSKSCYLIMHCDFVDTGTTANDCGADVCIKGPWQLIQKPHIDWFSNGNKYNNNDGISAEERSITLLFINNGPNAATKFKWKIDGYTDWNTIDMDVPVSVVTNNIVKTYTIPWDFQPGTEYTLRGNLWNTAGWGDNEGVVTIRTLHSKPVLTISHDHNTQSGLEDITISWESDKNIQEIQYTIDGSEWLVYATGLNLKSGTITIDKKNGEDLFDKTDYDIQVSVKSIDYYDYRWDATGNGPYQEVYCTTDERAFLENYSPRDIITGERLRIQKQNESGNNNQIRLYVANPEILWKTENSPNSNDYYITITQDEWDTAYKKFISPADFSKSADEHNKIPFKIQVITSGRSRNYTKEYTGWLILNGNMLTTYTNVNGTVKRGKVWVKPGAEVKRGVTWISTATGHWRRGI